MGGDEGVKEKAEIKKQQLDTEWLELILIARYIGLSLDEIRQFFLTVNKKQSFFFIIKRLHKRIVVF